MRKREFYIPEGAMRIRFKKLTGTEVYLFQSKGGSPSAIGFKGRAQKPAFNYIFPDDQHRADHLERWIADLIDRERKKIAARKTPHTLTEGDILISIWGYNQTNVTFYSVRRIVGKTMVELQEIGNQWAPKRERPCSMSAYVIPDHAHSRGDPFRKKVSMYNGQPVVSLENYETAIAWDGEPKLQTWSA